jgi:ribosomal protein L37AE/L43A
MTEKNEIQNREKIFRECPNCSSKMEKGRLQTAGHGISHVFFEPAESKNDPLTYISTSAWYCRKCEQFLLFADFSDQDTNE